MPTNFEGIYLQFKEMVYNICLSYLQNREDAEEVTQDVFVKVYQKMGGFKQKANIKTWIYRITINASLDFLKAKKRKKRLGFLTSIFHRDSSEITEQFSHFDHPGVLLEHKEGLERLFKAINKLADKQKTVLILSKIEGQSQKEIAMIMDSSPKAVESLLQRAKQNLKKILANNEGITF